MEPDQDPAGFDYSYKALAVIALLCVVVVGAVILYFALISNGA